MLENIKSGIGEWNSVIGSSMSQQPDRRLHHARREPRRHRQAVPVRRHPRGRTAQPTRRSAPSRSRRTTSCATTRSSCRTTSRKFGNRHSLTFGVTRRALRVRERVLPGCKQSVYVYNSLADFYTDANGFLANPNRTTSPVTLRRFQVRYMQHPGPGQADPAAGGLVRRRLRAGRVAAAQRT